MTNPNTRAREFWIEFDGDPKFDNIRTFRAMSGINHRLVLDPETEIIHVREVLPDDIYQKRLDWLIARVHQLTEALEKIMNVDGGPVTMCETARKALEFDSYRETKE